MTPSAPASNFVGAKNAPGTADIEAQTPQRWGNPYFKGDN